MVADPGQQPEVVSADGRAETLQTPGFLVLLNQRGDEVSRVLHDVDGTIVVHPPAPGRYRIRSERTGRSVFTSTAFEVNRGQILDFAFDIEDEPVRLDSIIPNLPGECRGRPTDHPGLGAVWEEVRKALSAVQWSGGVVRHVFRGTRFDRTVGPDGAVEREATTEVSVPFVLARALPAGDRDRFATTHAGMEAMAPVAIPGVFLAPEFRTDHCFSTTHDPVTGTLDVHFSSTSARGTALRGTFRLDIASAELRSVDYETVGSARGAGQQASESVQLTRVPSGRWVVTAWTTHLPAANQSTVRQVGGLTTSITDQQDGAIYRVPAARLTGTVTAQGTPLAGATVTFSGSDAAASTDAQGRFAMTGVFNGTYGLVVTYNHPLFDSLSFVPSTQTVTLAAGVERAVTIEVPPLQAMIHPVCPDLDLTAGERIIAGVVRDGTTRDAVASARVVVRLIGRDEDAESVVLTDDSGRYLVCGVPPDAPVELRAEFSQQASNAVTLAFQQGGVDRPERYRSGGDDETFVETTSATWTEDFQIFPLPPARGVMGKSLGFRAGQVNSTVVGQDIDAGTVTGMQFAFFYRTRFHDHWSLQFEGQYSRQGAVSFQDDQTMSLNYFKLPVLVSYWFSGDSATVLSPYLYGGPAVGFETRGHRGVPRGDIGLIFGGGLAIGRGGTSLLLDAAFNLGITTVEAPPIREPGQNEQRVERFFDGQSFRNQTFSFSAGIAFPIGSKVLQAGVPGVPIAAESRNRGRDFITRDEILEETPGSAYDMVQRLRPTWLRVRNQASSITQEIDSTMVYVNGSRRGNIEELRAISSEEILEIQFMDPGDATLRYGTGHAAGAILVTMRR
jgi:hypothetical protein